MYLYFILVVCLLFVCYKLNFLSLLKSSLFVLVLLMSSMVLYQMPVVNEQFEPVVKKGKKVLDVVKKSAREVSNEVVDVVGIESDANSSDFVTKYPIVSGFFSLIGSVLTFFKDGIFYLLGRVALKITDRLADMVGIFLISVFIFLLQYYFVDNGFGKLFGKMLTLFFTNKKVLAIEN